MDDALLASQHLSNRTALHVPLVSDQIHKCGLVQYSMLRMTPINRMAVSA